MRPGRGRPKKSAIAAPRIVIKYYTESTIKLAFLISALRCSMFQYRASSEFVYLIDKDMMMQLEPPTSLLMGGVLLNIAFGDCQPRWKGSFILSSL